MRVDQLITLVWIGNVLLLGSTGWVGWKFYGQNKKKSQVAKVEWPDAADRSDITKQRWPGPVSNFQHIWKADLSGPLPPPPVAVGPVKPVEVDIRTLFKNRVTLVTAWAMSNPESSIILVTDSTAPATPLSLRPGNKIDDWKLVKVSIGEDRLPRAKFVHPKDTADPLEIVATQPVIPTIGGSGVPKPFEPSFDVAGFVDQGDVSRTNLKRQAYLDADTNEWVVPPDEALWWATYGSEEILQKTKLVARPQGLEIASQPPLGTLDSSRGITQGDILVSVNGVEIRSDADLYAYFRGDGRDLDRYVVVIERDGARRTQVYRVTRRRATRST